jgi:hypothetical protein
LFKSFAWRNADYNKSRESVSNKISGISHLIHILPKERSVIAYGG